MEYRHVALSNQIIMCTLNHVCIYALASHITFCLTRWT
jgi:hypothetical protein